MSNLFDLDPLVITALHLPELGAQGASLPMSWLEDYVFQNMSVFAEGGLEAVILQDETLNVSSARPEIIAILTALAYEARREFPQIHLGIIVQAHDPFAPIAVAHASGAEFVRIKTYVGAMVKAEGVQEGCGIVARDYRRSIGREDILILSDVHDRGGYPLGDVSVATASKWAVKAGADGLVLTGANPEKSLEFVKAVRDVMVTKPVLVGGGVNGENVHTILKHADGIIVSSAFKRKNFLPTDIVRWDLDALLSFTERARTAQKQ